VIDQNYFTGASGQATVSMGSTGFDVVGISHCGKLRAQPKTCIDITFICLPE